VSANSLDKPKVIASLSLALMPILIASGLAADLAEAFLAMRDAG
jgi:hypothetical protein